VPPSLRGSVSELSDAESCRFHPGEHEMEKDREEVGTAEQETNLPGIKRQRDGGLLAECLRLLEERGTIGNAPSASA